MEATQSPARVEVPLSPSVDSQGLLIRYKGIKIFDTASKHGSPNIKQCSLIRIYIVFFYHNELFRCIATAQIEPGHFHRNNGSAGTLQVQ